MKSRIFGRVASGICHLIFLAGVAGCSPSASLGPEIGPNDLLTAQDQKMARGAFQNALETSVSGKGVTWRNTATGASGSVTPVKTWKTSAGVYCRAYRENIRLASGQSQALSGTACRSKAGTWQTA